MSFFEYLIILSIMTGLPLSFLYVYEKIYCIYYKKKKEESKESISNKGR